MTLICIAISLLILGSGLWIFLVPFTSRKGLLDYIEGYYKTLTTNIVVILGFVLLMAGLISLVFGLALVDCQYSI